MKSRFIIFFIITVLAILAFLFWRRSIQSLTSAKQSQVVVQTSNAPVASVSVASQSTPVGANPTPVISTNLKSRPSPTNQVGLKEAIEKLVESRNGPINFYGQVIDQNSNALSGASIKVSIMQLTPDVTMQELIGSKEIHLERASDANGRFELHGEIGQNVYVESIKKDGYEVELGPRTFGAVGGSYDNPVIFKMWSTNAHEKLITGEKSFQIAPDGRSYFINLTDDTISESGNGDLKVWVQYTNQAVRGQLYDWSAGIEVVNGGLLEEDDKYSSLYLAPTDGYTPSFQLHQQIKGGQSGEIGDRRFYILLKNGQEYGRMNINLYAPYGYLYPGLIHLSYAINPSGSRILR